MSVVKEFKEFAVRGNVVDMAVGVIMGGAFGKIVTSLLNDVLMPPLGMIVGRVDFKDLSITLKSSEGGAKAVTLNYGAFITTVVDFAIVAFAIFLMVKLINTLKKNESAPAPVPTEKTCPECLMNIPVNAKRCGHCASIVPA